MCNAQKCFKIKYHGIIHTCTNIYLCVCVEFMPMKTYRVWTCHALSRLGVPSPVHQPAHFPYDLKLILHPSIGKKCILRNFQMTRNTFKKTKVTQHLPINSQIMVTSRRVSNPYSEMGKEMQKVVLLRSSPRKRIFLVDFDPIVRLRITFILAFIFSSKCL